MAKLTIIKDEKGNVLLKTLKEVSVSIVDITEGLKDFEPDLFIQSIRDMQKDKQLKNRGEYETLKCELLSKGFIIEDSNFLPEYTDEMHYAASESEVVLDISKDNIMIEARASGLQRINVFDDHSFFFKLDELVKEGKVTQETYDYLRKAFYFYIKHEFDNNGDQCIECTEPWSNVGDIVPLTDEHEHAIEMVIDHDYDCVKSFKYDDIRDEDIPVAWFGGFRNYDNNNWIEIYCYKEVDGKQEEIDESYIYETGNFLDFVKEIESIYAETVSNSVNTEE